MAAVALSVFGVVMLMAALWPQPGYIHPDQFFQSVEVVAGDIFNVSHLRTWEFSADLSLRDISLPYLLFAPGFHLLRAALPFTQRFSWFHESYALLIIPRLTLLVAGLVNYCLVCKLCKVFAVDRKTALWYWATSFAVWTFLLQTFSNTTETLLFSAAWILILDLSSHCSGSKSEETRVGGGRTSGGYKKRSLLLGSVVCMGIFNRPTFGVFVGAPLLWLLDRLLTSGSRRGVRIGFFFLSSIGFLLTFAVQALFNSLYYNPEFKDTIRNLLVSIEVGDTEAMIRTFHAALNGMRIPPWNFVRYNFMATNLAEHGLHPWYTHLAVNVPLLLGPLAALVFWDTAVMMKQYRRKEVTDVLYASMFLPVLALSCFPHQEARFLLPVLPVAVVCAARNKLASWKTFKAVTLIFNIAAHVVFGWFHQGGVVPALSAIQRRLKYDSDPGTRYHVVSYSTYMLPRHLLFNSRNLLHVDDMLGAHNHPPTFRLRMENLNSACLEANVTCSVFVLVPAPALKDLESLEWKWNEEGQYCPHLSLERFPNVSKWWLAEHFQTLISQFCLKWISLTTIS